MRLGMDDAIFVNKVFSHPAVWPFITDDHAKEEHRFISGTLSLSNPLAYLLSPNEFTVFMLLPRSLTTYEVHTAILPEGRGRMAVEAGKAAARWMFEHTTCEKLVGDVAADQKAMLLYSRLVGFKREGICTKSIRRNGQLLDQVMFGLEKESLCQLSQQ